MRVLVGSLSRNFGGVESLFRNIVQANYSDAVQFDFICTDSSAANEADFIAAGAKVIHIPRPSRSIGKYIGAFRRVFAEGKYDVYHVNLTRFRFPLDVIIARACGVKVVLHCHSTRIYNNVDKKTQIIRNIEQVLFRPVMLHCSSMNIACSKNAGEYLFRKRPYTILHNGIYLDKFLFDECKRAQIREKLGIPDNCTIVGHVGRFSIEKNHRFLLKVAKALLHSDDRYRFLCVGTGALLDSIKREAAQLGILDHFVFTGQRNAIGELLSAMDVFLFPSIHEALPITLIEAQANGLPCVVSDVITEEIDVGQMITRVNLHENEKAWAKTVNAAAKNRLKEVSLADFGDFDIREMIPRLYQIYDEILSYSARVNGDSI